MTDDPLLEPFRLKNLTIRNRIFSSAHEPAYSEDGMPKDRYRLYHEEKAKGGIGLTMTAGSAVVAPDSPPAFGNLHAYKDEIVPWIRRLTDGVHEHGAAVMIQITHLGRRTTWGQADWLPVVSASPLREPAHRAIPKEAEGWDIDRIIDGYADTAERMMVGGMDGIEVEAYGHLLDQFLSPLTNRRTDDYGGSFDNRFRFGHDVLTAIRKRVGGDFIVGIRMVLDETVDGGIDTPIGLAVLKRLEIEGLIDFVNVIRGHIATETGLTKVIPIQGMAAAPHLDYAGTIRNETSLAVLHASRIDELSTARYAIAQGKLDLVGMTRAHIADPHIVAKLEAGHEDRIRPCVGATYCLDRIYEAGEALCLHNAATSREADIAHVMIPVPRAAARRIVVVGAGPGGLEAARVAAERGHNVYLLEAMPLAGGQLRLAIRNPRRKDLIGIIDWRLSELERMGVDVAFNIMAESSDVTNLDPDVVVIATGGQPQVPHLDVGSNLVVTSWDVLGGHVSPTGSVLFFDDNGTHSALSAAEILVRRDGVDLEIVTPERMFGVDVGGLNHVPYARAFNETNTRITINQRVTAVERTADGRLSVTLGSEYSEHCDRRVVDSVVVDHGTLPITDLYVDLKPLSSNLGRVDYPALIDGRLQTAFDNVDGAFQLFRIGDAVANRNVHAAIYDAVRFARAF